MRQFYLPPNARLQLVCCPGGRLLSSGAAALSFGSVQPRGRWDRDSNAKRRRLFATDSSSGKSQTKPIHPAGPSHPRAQYVLRWYAGAIRARGGMDMGYDSASLPSLRLGDRIRVRPAPGAANTNRYLRPRWYIVPEYTNFGRPAFTVRPTLPFPIPKSHSRSVSQAQRL